jgi:hypothetical protein
MTAIDSRRLSSNPATPVETMSENGEQAAKIMEMLAELLKDSQSNVEQIRQSNVRLEEQSRELRELRIQNAELKASIGALGEPIQRLEEMTQQVNQSVREAGALNQELIESNQNKTRIIMVCVQLFQRVFGRHQDSDAPQNLGVEASQTSRLSIEDVSEESVSGVTAEGVSAPHRTAQPAGDSFLQLFGRQFAINGEHSARGLDRYSHNR